MTSRVGRLRRGAALLVVAGVVGLPQLAAAFFDQVPAQVELAEQRERYLRLSATVRRGNWENYERERAALADYPLAPYLDYAWHAARLSRTDGGQMRDFANANAASPLGVRLLGYYLAEAGKSRRWEDFLEAAVEEPRSERLRCYYARALRTRGRDAESRALTERLWLSPRSVDAACDPLFKVWRDSGSLSEALVWERATLAFGASGGSLLRYLGSLAPAGSQTDFAVLRESYQHPQRSVALAGKLEGPRRAEVLTLGLERYARYNPEAVLRQLESLDPQALGPAQRARVERAIAFRGLVEKQTGVLGWIDGSLAAWSDDTLTEMRLRWALAEGDFAAVEAIYPALSSEARDSALWRYWRGRALEMRGESEAARAEYAAAARERDYYGFLSADRLAQAYSFRDDSLLLAAAVTSASDTAVETSLAALDGATRAALWRVHELQAIDEPLLAHAEWAHTLQRLETADQRELAQLAIEQGWYRFSIDAATASRSWDALDWRFPLAYRDAFGARAAALNVSETELMAIARRESAFFPRARSPVGARGLMQLMPATGIAVARAAGMQLNVGELYSVKHNVDLGSAYYRQLLDQFDNRRPVALAAYNAGPNRVKNWLGRDLPVDIWVETIPYRETRDYVKAVLAYRVVFDYRMGRDVQLLSAAEHAARY